MIVDTIESDRDGGSSSSGYDNVGKVPTYLPRIGKVHKEEQILQQNLIALAPSGINLSTLESVLTKSTFPFERLVHFYLHNMNHDNSPPLSGCLLSRRSGSQSQC